MDERPLIGILQRKDLPARGFQFGCRLQVQWFNAVGYALQLVKGVVKTLGEQGLFIGKMVIKSALGYAQLLSNFIE